MYDVLIKNGKLVDGSGNPWFYGSVGIRDGLVVEIGRACEESGKLEINAEGLCVSPGFIDMHTHTELAYYEHPQTLFKVSQGVTTEFGGQCAISAAPVNDATRDEIRRVNNPLCGLGNLDYAWNSMEEYFECISKRPHINNIAQLVGHNAIRSMAMGFENRSPLESELSMMKQFLKEAMDAGAYGLSIAGVQSPSNFAFTEEYTELAKIVAAEGGLFEGHMRSESNALLESIAEMIIIGRKSGVRTQISHLKVAGSQNWYKAEAALALIREARQNGLDIACNQYPYTYASFNLEALLPLWVRGGSFEELVRTLQNSDLRKKIERDMMCGLPETGWESVFQWCGYGGITIANVNTPRNTEYLGLTIEGISKLSGKPCIDVLCDLIVEEGLGVLMLLEFGKEEDVETILRFPYTAPVTDALATHLSSKKEDGGCHPRIFGTFTKVLGHYVRERNLITLEEAVRRMTSLPAGRIGLKDRGLLREGYAADIVLFNEHTVKDCSSGEKPRALSDGIEAVLVNGELVYKDKTVTGNLPGKYLKKNE